MPSFEKCGKTRESLVIVLLGPTASGKTELAVDIADQLQLNILNVDSRQLYIGMDIGTAKPTKEQREKVTHHLIDIRQPDEQMNIQTFKKEADLRLESSLREHQKAFLVGGSGLYIKAITAGLRPAAVAPQKQLREQLIQIGQQENYQILQKNDPAAAERISPKDAVRTQRALEILYATGDSITNQETTEKPPWKILELGLNPQNLKERIITRTNHLYKNGLIEETQSLINRFGRELPLLQTIGYKEVLEIIQGELNLQEAIQKTILRTNQFAKRQRTWFRRQHNPHWLNDEEPLREALSLIQSRLS